jgi:hypothetical protein
MNRPITRRAAMAASLGWLLAGEIAATAPRREHAPERPERDLPRDPMAARLREIEEYTW